MTTTDEISMDAPTPKDPLDGFIGWWRKDVHRPHKRKDGIPTRSDIRWDTDAERAIRKALAAVEKAGASVNLTRAAGLLIQARELVANHVEGIPETEA